MRTRKRMEQFAPQRERKRITDALKNGVPIYNPVGSFIRREDSFYLHQTQQGVLLPFTRAEAAVESFLREENYLSAGERK